MTANAQVFTNDQNVANKGYDMVNYFVTNTAERGTKQFSTSYGGATYYFVNQSNLDTFKEGPETYLPQFDGYCSFAVAKMNEKVPVNPETFRIDDGKLYFFFNDYYEGAPFNTIIPWLQNEGEMEKMAAVNWKTLNSTTITRIYGPDLRALPIKFPQNEKEQERIADCLSVLDDQIGVQARKLDTLKLHKQGLLQQLFPSPEAK